MITEKSEQGVISFSDIKEEDIATIIATVTNDFEISGIILSGAIELKDKNFEEILDLTTESLTHLNLAQNYIKRLNLSKHSNLVRLDLSDCYSLSDIELPTKFACLEECNLQKSQSLKATDIVTLIKQAEKLTHLNIGSCKQLDDDAAREILSSTRSLTKLDISRSNITKIELTANLNNLEIFDISDCQKLKSLTTDVNFDLSRLNFLDLHGLRELPTDQIINLISKAPNLVELNIKGCDNLDDNQVKFILDTTKNLKKATISDLRITNLDLDNPTLEILDLKT
jgi:hypothetical protein